jgi:3',5'-cyclic AMP phosphodiesterase CpdA
VDGRTTSGTDVRYVCLSDLHFGAENSILTELRSGSVEVDPHAPSAAMRGLVDCLAAVVAANTGARKPILVLDGDILELALASDNIAAMVFEQFVGLAFPASGHLFDSTVYYVPGNHDHHLWEGAREGQYAEYVRRRPRNQDLENPWHVTRMFTEQDAQPVQSELLNTLVERTLGARGVTVRTIYPNLALGDGTRCVALHHGHYLESIYRLMSVVKSYAFPSRPRPVTAWEIEAENFAWIDFFWSTLGRSGDVGVDVGLIYASFQSDQAMDRIAGNLAKGLKKHLPGPAPLRWVEDLAFRPLLRHMLRKVGQLERSQPTESLTQPAREELVAYLDGPLRAQFEAECATHDERLPEKLTFIFGHTHKPFVTQVKTGAYSQPVDVHNTGGWVVDTLDPLPLQGGSAVLISEQLDVVSLAMYRQTADRSPSTVQLLTADGASPPGEFLQRLQGVVHPDAPPWSTFSAAAAELVAQRHRDLARILELRGERPST